MHDGFERLWIRNIISAISAHPSIRIQLIYSLQKRGILFHISKTVFVPAEELEILQDEQDSDYPGRTFPREQLIEDIWGYDFHGNDRTLDVHINRLRERFPEQEHSFKITTIRGLGYRLEVRS